MSFQNGVDIIVEGCITYGSTPTENTPTSIVESIKTIYTNRYSEGQSSARSLYYLGEINYTGTILTSSRRFDFDYSHVPNYTSLTTSDFIIGMSGSKRIIMKNANGDSRLTIKDLSGGKVRINWWGNAEGSGSVQAYVYCIA